MQLFRRKDIRYGHCGLGLSVARSGLAGFLKLNPLSECMDFSLSGMQFSCNQACLEGEKLVLDLVIQDLELYEINAVVVTCQKERPDNYCVGVRFCFLAQHMQKPQVIHKLLQIEDRLRIATEYPVK